VSATARWAPTQLEDVMGGPSTGRPVRRAACRRRSSRSGLGHPPPPNHPDHPPGRHVRPVPALPAARGRVGARQVAGPLRLSDHAPSRSRSRLSAEKRLKVPAVAGQPWGAGFLQLASHDPRYPPRRPATCWAEEAVRPTSARSASSSTSRWLEDAVNELKEKARRRGPGSNDRGWSPQIKHRPPGRADPPRTTFREPQCAPVRFLTRRPGRTPRRPTTAKPWAAEPHRPLRARLPAGSGASLPPRWVAIKGLCREGQLSPRSDVGPKGRGRLVSATKASRNPVGLIEFVTKNQEVAWRIPAGQQGGGQGRVGNPRTSASTPPRRCLTELAQGWRPERSLPATPGGTMKLSIVAVTLAAAAASGQRRPGPGGQPRGHALRGGLQAPCSRTRNLQGCVRGRACSYFVGKLDGASPTSTLNRGDEP